jgi:GTP-binding protein
MLVHLVELTPLEGEPVANYELIRAELAAYGAGLERLPELVVLSKRDLLEAVAVDAAIAEWTERLGGSVLGVMAASSATGEGLEDLRRRILAELAKVQPIDLSPTGAPAAEFESEHRVYRPAGEGGYWVEPEEDGVFRIGGRGVELLFERHDTNNDEALAYLEQRLTEMGVISALRKAGFEVGDEVRVGENEFELHV